MKKNSRIEGKISFILFTLTLTLSCLVGRVFYIKTVHGEEYEKAAKTQQVSQGTIISPNRGIILDRNKQALAVSTTVYNVILDCRVLSQADAKIQEKTVLALSEALSDDEEKIDAAVLRDYIAINTATGKPNLDSSWKILKRKVDKSVVDKLKEQGITTGVVYEKDTKREYTLKTVASHVLGFIRGDTKLGLEAQYNTEMSGVPGRKFTAYDDSSSAVTQEIPAEDGNTIITTLDYTIQQYAETAVKDAMAEYNPENAAVLVMNPNTGEILAMASGHPFDNNNPAEPLEMSDAAFASSWEMKNTEEQYEYLNNVWNNFNVSSTFEPGSIFKPMVVAAALEEEIITTNSTYECYGHKMVSGEKIHCNKTTGHGHQSLEDVLANSCNVGMMDIGEKMGKNIFYKYQKDFGIGTKTGIDLPGEASASSLMHAEDSIGPVDLATMSFGQSFNCTTIQILSAFSAVINGGNLMKPYIVSQVVDKDGIVINETKPEIVRKVISKQTSDIVRNYSKSVIDRGTGKKAKVEGYSIGGKTGTAQQGNRKEEKYTVSYCTFLPVEKPELAIISVIHLPPNYADGVTSAGPMTKKLLESIIKYKAMEPAYVVDGAAMASSKKAVVAIGDYVGMTLPNVSIELDNMGVDYETVGVGNLVTSQAPHSGTEVEEGSKIILYVTKGEGDTGDTIVPDVEGLSYEDAVGKIVGVKLEAVIEGSESGIVKSQEPKPGVYVDSGTDVKIILEEKATE